VKRWSVVLILAACGGSSSRPSTARSTAPSPSATPSGEVPVLLARPIWDGPLTDPMALRLVERVQTAVDDAPPRLQGADPRMWLGPVQVWVDRRSALGREIRADVDAIREDPDPRMQLLAAVAFAVAMDDLASDVASLEMPAEAAHGEHGSETQLVFREALEEQAYPLAQTAREALQWCEEVATHASAPLRMWEAYCRERHAALSELVARVQARGKTVVPKLQ
jgi:hypothetical protein